MKKKILAVFSIIAVSVLIFTGCSQTAGNPPAGGGSSLSQSGSQTQIQKRANIETRANNEVQTSAATAPAVYMTADISPQGLMEVYKALGRALSGSVAVKLSTGAQHRRGW